MDFQRLTHMAQITRPLGLDALLLKDKGSAKACFAFDAAMTRFALGAVIETGMQVGKQLLGQIQEKINHNREMTDIKWKCIEINVSHLLLSGGFSIFAPSMLASAKTLISSGKALKTLSNQAANTTNRAAKLTARKADHSNEIKKTVTVQATWQTGKIIAKCPVKDETPECKTQ